jgi:hypothetical protein
MAKMTKRISNYEAGTNGAFMGFETSDSEDTENSDLEQGTVKNVSFFIIISLGVLQYFHVNQEFCQ